MKFIGFVGLLVLSGCLGSPAERTCADFPPGTAGCEDGGAGDDGVGDVSAGDVRVEDVRVGDEGAGDGGGDAEGDRGAEGDAEADAGGDAGAGCEPGAVEPCAADGFCGGRRVCGEDGEWSACVPDEPVDEACNGRDDDCDGEVDEVGDRPCGIDVGACAAGVERCAAGRWSCEGAVGPAEDEACDGVVDEDCDGSVDEGCPCTEGMVEPCGASDVGACELGERQCGGDGWSACSGAVGPGGEQCNGEDDDCDGAVDEALRQACGSGVGACVEGSQVCAGGAWGACDGGVVPGVEGCDGIDDDCDGSVDEGVVAACGSDVGICDAGVKPCVGGVFGECGAVVEPGEQVEGCGPGALDEDCDGSADEGCGCIEGEQRPCGSSEGWCELGQQACMGGQFAACLGGVGPQSEGCDGIDDDCDGTVDEGFGLGEACQVGVGACRRNGVRVCGAGLGVCDAQPGVASNETCSGVDEDCDGRVDEGLAPFVVGEVRLSAGSSAVGPVIAALGDRFGVARVQTGALIGGLGRRAVEVVFNSYDERGRAIGPDVVLVGGLNSVSALAIAAFDNRGEAGFAVFFAAPSRDLGVDGDGATVAAVVIFPAARDPEVSEVLPLVPGVGEVTSLDGASSGAGIGLVWSVDSRVFYGFIDFRVEPPQLVPVQVATSADGGAVVWDGSRFVVGWRAALPLMRTQAVRFAVIDRGRPGAVVTVAEGASLGAPQMAAGEGGVQAVWQSGAGGGKAVFFSPVELDGDAIARPIQVSPAGVAAGDPAVAFGPVGMGVAWVDEREGAEEGEVWFRQLTVSRGAWRVATAPLAISRGVGDSRPVDLAAGLDFGVLWYDAQPESPGVYFSAGPLGCTGADPVQ